MRARGCFCRKDVARRVPRAVWKFPPRCGAPRSSVLGPRWGQRDLVSCRSQLQPALWAEAIPTVPSNSQPFFPPPQYPCQPGAPCCGHPVVAVRGNSCRELQPESKQPQDTLRGQPGAQQQLSFALCSKQHGHQLKVGPISPRSSCLSALPITQGERVTGGAWGCCSAPHLHLPQLLGAPTAATAQTRSVLLCGLSVIPLHPHLIAFTEEEVQIPTKSQKKERLPNLQLFLERERARGEVA